MLFLLIGVAITLWASYNIKATFQKALENLAGAFCDDKPSQLFYIRNGKNVWYTRGR